MRLKFVVLSMLTAVAAAQPMVIKTTALFDGRGHMLRNQLITIENGRITRVSPTRGKSNIDLSGLTVMPGWIDTHVHPTWYFKSDGKLELGGAGSKSTPQQAALSAAANLHATVMGGFTTVQSVGAAFDADLRDFINRGALAGPRLLTSLAQITERSGDPAQIRALVDQLKAQGTDVI